MIGGTSGKMIMDFSKRIKDNKGDAIWIAAHRGVSAANIPCNTLAAFGIVLQQKAEIVEIDVAQTADGVLCVFHPGKEAPHLRSNKVIAQMTWEETSRLRFVNQDDEPTHYPVETLDDVLDFLKGKCYVNVDKFWMDIPAITACIRRHGMEHQVIVKTPCAQEHFDRVKACAPDLAIMPMIRAQDVWTERLLGMVINYAGAEVIFSKESDPVASEAYIASMHRKGLLVWVNAIVYDETAVISAGHTDDVSLTRSPDEGWGWLRDRGFDIIQTGWPLMLRHYLAGK